MTFTLFENQHGILQADPIDAGGAPSTVTGEAAVVDQPATLSIAPVAGQPNQFLVTAQGKAGSTFVTVSGVNSAGATVSTRFDFNIEATPAVGFTGQLLSVANN